VSARRRRPAEVEPERVVDAEIVPEAGGDGDGAGAGSAGDGRSGGVGDGGGGERGGGRGAGAETGGAAPADGELGPVEELLAAELSEDLVPAAAEQELARALAPVSGRTLPARLDPTARYIAEVRAIPPLGAEEEARLARLFRDTGDRDAAAQLVNANLLLVVKLALMYRRFVDNLMDLVQEGNVGLMEAVKRFDPEQGSRFSTYAAWWIKAYILKYLQDNRRIVRFGTTNDRRKLLYHLRSEQAKLAAQGVQATPKLLAARLDVSESDVVEAEKVLAARDASLDQPLTAEGSATLADVLADDGADAEQRVIAEDLQERTRRALEEFRATLSERDRAILDQRLGALDESTLQELGDRFGVTREAMRQAEVKLRQRLAAFLRDRLGDDVIRGMIGGG
jgi:RNA polymerase sigma-32 factor